MFPRLPCFDSCKPLVPNNCCIHMQNECQFVNKQNIFPGTSFRMFLYLSLIQNLIWYQNFTIFLVWDVWLITEHLNSWDHIGWTDPLWINRNREGISMIKFECPTRKSDTANTFEKRETRLCETQNTSDKMLHVYTRNCMLLWTQLHAYEICCFSRHREIKKLFNQKILRTSWCLPRNRNFDDNVIFLRTHSKTNILNQKITSSFTPKNKICMDGNRRSIF